MWTVLIVCVVVLGMLMLAWKKPGWAVALLPLTSLGPIIAGILSLDFCLCGHVDCEAATMALVVTGILVLVLTVSVVVFKPMPNVDTEPWYKVVSSVLFKSFLWIVYGAVLVIAFHLFGGFLFIVSLMVALRYRQTRRYSLALNVLSTLSAAIRQNLPLPMALETAAANRKDPAAKIYRQIAGGLCEGRSLSDSLRRAYRRCPVEVLATVSAGEAMNQLPQALAALEKDSLANLNGFEKVRPVHPAYPLLVAAVAIMIVLGLCVFIVPTLKEVLYDVTGGQAQMPASTQLLMDLGQSLQSGRGLYALAVVFLLQGILVFAYVRPPRGGRLSRVGDWFRWHMPVVRHFERLRALQRTVQTLRVGLVAGYSFDAVVRQTLRLEVNACFRSKLRRWLKRIEAGQPVADSAAACGLGPMLAWALDEKVNKGNTAELLAMLEEVYRNRYHYRLNIAHSVTWPLVVVAMGGGVGFVVYAMFASMVSLIVYTLDYSMP